MRVVIPGLIGIAFLAKFTHVQKEDTPKLSSDGAISERFTECKILQQEEGKEELGFISIGYARCHPKDNFSKEKGRQISLAKALEDGDFTKEIRTIFWDEYRNWGKERF